MIIAILKLPKLAFWSLPAVTAQSPKGEEMIRDFQLFITTSGDAVKPKRILSLWPFSGVPVLSGQSVGTLYDAP